MTLPLDSTISGPYGADGESVDFVVRPRFFDDSDLLVVVYVNGVRTVKTYGDDYTVTGAGDQSGGMVTFIIPPEEGSIVYIIRRTRLEQNYSYAARGNFPSVSHELLMDRMVAISQELQEQVERCPSFSEISGQRNVTLPAPSNGYLRSLSGALLWDSGVPTPVSQGGGLWLSEGSTIQEAVAAIGSSVVSLHVPAGVYEFSSDFEVPSNITLHPENGAVFTRLSGSHLTISGPFVCGPWKCFEDNTASGDWVKLGPGSVIHALPEWWGASGEDSDQAPYINMAVLALYSGGCNGTVVVHQDHRIDQKVKLYPGVGFDMLPGAKLTTTEVITMLGSYQPTVKTLNFRIGHIQLDGSSKAAIGLDLTGMSQSFVKSWIIDNCDEPIYCDHTVGGAYNNTMGCGTVSGAVNGIDISTNDLYIAALRVLGTSAYGVKLNGAGLQIGQLYTISCPTQVQFSGANNAIGMLYIEDGVSTVYGVEWAAGSTRNRVRCIQYDAGHVLPDNDLAVYPDGFGNEIENMPLLSRTAVNLIKNGDMMQWGSATVPLGFTGSNTSKATLNHQEKAVSLNAVVGAAAALHQGTPGTVLGPAWLPTGERSLVVGVSYLRRTVAMEGSLAWRISLRFYDILNNLLQTHNFPYVSWDSVANDDEPTLYTNRVGVPTGAVMVGWDLTFQAVTGATQGSLIIRDVGMNQGINLSIIPVQFERTHYLTATPTTGTWDLYDVILHATPTNGQPAGWRVATAGTMGTLSGVTGSINAGTALLTVNSVANLRPGMYVSVAGVTGTKRILSINGLVCTLDSNADATVAGAAVAYVAATFLKMANLAA